MELEATLRRLCEAQGISGAEDEAARTALELLRPYAKTTELDAFHNVIGVIREAGEEEPHVLLDAHIDEIGLIVTAIDSMGFLHVANCGGVDRRLLLGQEVEVLVHPPVIGVVATIPPHLSGNAEKKVPEIDDVVIDIGRTKEDAEQVVCPGDRVRLCSSFHRLLGSRVSSHALDDRSCVAIILRALELLQGQELHCGLSVLFSAQEETGERGAKVAAYRINPDIAIALDVSFAHTPDASPYKCGKMGKGTMIGIAPTLTKEISDQFVALAKEKGLAYQMEVMGSSTGTNADVLSVTRGGVKTGLLSLPLKYMHTPVEVVDLNDMEAAAQLLSAYLLSIGEEKR